MQRNISFNYLHNNDVNLVHVISHGLFADGENGVVRNLRFNRA